MASLPNIVTCFPLSDPQLRQIRAFSLPRYNVIEASMESIGRDIMDATIFFGHAKTPVDWAAVVSQGKLKWIQSSAAGLDHCLTPEVIESDIPVSGCSALFAPQVAETSMALLMGLLRSLPTFFAAKSKQEYIRRYTDELFGKTVGIVGYGGNGQQIARTLAPMTRRIVATDKFPDATDPLPIDQRVAEVLPSNQLVALLEQSDVVIVTLPLSAENEKLFSDQQFSAMRQGSYFVNVGRGSVVDQDALIRSIESGHLKGVGIDVADPEPIAIDSQLWRFDNVIITPHIGAQSKFRIPRTIDLFEQNLNRFVAGETLLNWVDKQLGYPRPEHRFMPRFV